MRTSRKRTASRTWLLLGLLAMFAGASAGAAEAELDPIVAEVIAMLQAGVDEGVIVQWLESTDRRPADVGSRGVIALTEAKASGELIKTLMTLVEEQREGAAEVESVVAPAHPAAAGGAVETLFQLRAKRVWTDEDEPDRPRDPPWDVYLYLDGEFIVWTRPTMQGEPVEVRRVVGAGRRELRVVLQRYEELRGGWLQESLSVPTLVSFAARPGDPLEIEVEMHRIWGLWRQRKDGGPLRFVIRQGDVVLTENGGTGGDPARWRPVCEDVEANFSVTETVPKRFRNPMSRCVRWSQLWTGAGQSTSRAEILARLAEYDFQPPAR